MLEIILLTIFIFNGFITLLVLVLMFRVFKKYVDTKGYLTDFEQVKELAAKNVKSTLEKLLQEVEQTMEISDEAKKRFEQDLKVKIDQIISKVNEDIQNQSNKITEQYQKNLEAITSGVGERIQTSVEEIGKKAEEQLLTVGKISEEQILVIGKKSEEQTQILANQSLEETEKLAKFVTDKQVELENKLETIISDEKVRIQKELESYMALRLSEIDAKIVKILETVTQKSLGKAIDLKIHQEIVIDALEKAKKELL